MMHRLWRYDVFRYAQKDVARFTRNDAMFAQCAVRHTSLGEAVIIGEANIVCRRQTSLKKASLATCFFLAEAVGFEPTVP